MSNGWTGGQYSLVRAALGAYLAVHLALLARAAWTLPADVSPWTDWPGATVLLPLGALAGVLLAVGRFDRASALALILPTALSAASGRAGLVFPLCVLPFCAALPPAPYGSLAALGRSDPGGGWRFPDEMFRTLWILAAAVYALAGLLGRVWNTSEQSAVASLALLAYAALAVTRWRPWAWLALTLAIAAAALALPGRWLSPLALFLQALSFDPAWLEPARARVARLYYDGACGLCHRAVRFVLAEDAPPGRVRLAPLQGETFTQRVPGERRAALPDSVVVETADGALCVRSEATRLVLADLGGWWRVASWLLFLVPRPLRDAAYDLVARLRRRLFARPPALCPTVPAAIAARFDP